MLLYFISNNKEKAMKKYFAKYLPVEGEINIGDKYFTKRGVLHSCGIKPNSEMLNPEESLKKAKLFLCSRDTQVGDKVKWSEHNPDKPWLTQFGTETTIMNLGGLEPHPAWVKVIGEISPEATWVKEGDEFDENQLQIKYHITYRCLCKEKDGCEDESCQHYEGGVNKYVNGCYRQELLRTAYEIKVKGHCGHFH